MPKGRLFFIGRTLDDGPAKEKALNAAAAIIGKLWESVDKQLQKTSFVCGDHITIIDMMLAVYASWGEYFPVAIAMSERVRNYIATVRAHPALVKAAQDQQEASK